MAVTVTIYNSTAEFKKYVDKTIADIKTELGAHMALTEEIRKKYDRTKKRYETLKKLTGGKSDVLKDTKQLDVAGFRVLVNPTAEYELKLMEESVSSLQDKLNAFDRIKELYSVMTDETMKVGVVLSDGTPTGFMFYLQD
jgi:hypothetical protein